MDPHNGGNAVPEITREEHNHTLGAKNVNLVGSPTIYAVVNTSTAGDPKSFIGLTTTVIGSAPTIYAVVNTAAAGQASIVLDSSVNYIGLTTTTISNPTLYAVVNTTSAGQASVVIDNSVNSIGFATVQVASIVPGVGVDNLGKRYASTATSTDVGVVMLAKVLSADSHDSNNADNQYGRLSINDFRELRVRDQRAIDLANCNVYTDYTALSDDTTGLANATNHVFGVGGLTFNKVNGADNTVYGGVYKSLATTNLAEIFEAGGFVGMGVYIPSLTNVVNAFLRVGTDASNYNCWTWPTASLTAATWLNLRQSAAVPDYSRNMGTGWNTSAISYVAFGLEFNAEANLLNGIIFDHVHIVGGRITATDLSTAVTSTVNTANINVSRMGGTPVDTNNGTTTAATQRVTISSDSTGQVKLAGGVAQVGFATVSITNTTSTPVPVSPPLIGYLITSNVGNVTLSPSSNYIGLTTTTISNPTLYAVVNTPSANSTVFVGTATLNAVVNIPTSVGINAGVNGIGFATVNVVNQPALIAGTAAIGCVTVANTIALKAAAANIGCVTQLNQPALTASAAYIGLVTVANSVAVTGTFYQATQPVSFSNVTINSSVNNIGFATVAVSNATLYAVVNTAAAGQASIVLDTGTKNIGSVSILGGGIGINAGVNNIGFASVTPVAAWPDPKTYIGLVTVGHTVTVNAHALTAGVAGIGFSTVNVAAINTGANYIGLVSVNIGGTLPALSAGIAGIGFATVNIANTYLAGNVTLDDGSLVGIVGNVTLTDSKAFIGLATTVNGAGTQFIGLVTAWTRNAGTTKSLIPVTVNFSTTSVATIAVPTNANVMYVTSALLSANATTQLRIKSGVTYLTGNASIGISLNPGGGFMGTGSADSPVFIGCPSGAIVIEKNDITTSIGGSLIYFQE